MKEKLKISISMLINLQGELSGRYGVMLYPRNYYTPKVDPYFYFKQAPDNEIIDFIRKYFESFGGEVKFTDKDKRFVVYQR